MRLRDLLENRVAAMDAQVEHLIQEINELRTRRDTIQYEANKLRALLSENVVEDGEGQDQQSTPAR